MSRKFTKNDYQTRKKAVEKKYAHVLSGLVDPSTDKIDNFNKYVVESLSRPKIVILGSNSKQYDCLVENCIYYKSSSSRRFLAKYRFIHHIIKHHSNLMPDNASFFSNYITSNSNNLNKNTNLKCNYKFNDKNIKSKTSNSALILSTDLNDKPSTYVLSCASSYNNKENNNNINNNKFKQTKIDTFLVPKKNQQTLNTFSFAHINKITITNSKLNDTIDLTKTIKNYNNEIKKLKDKVECDDNKIKNNNNINDNDDDIILI